jgi:hypothetical protein
LPKFCKIPGILESDIPCIFEKGWILPVVLLGFISADLVNGVHEMMRDVELIEDKNSVWQS